MCEPAHSVVQYPDEPYDGPFSDGQSQRDALTTALGKGFGWMKKIGSWLHLSKFGAGHSGAKSNMTALSWNDRTRLYLPSPTNYEGLWWERKFELDMCQASNDAFESAKEYHLRSAMGNMSIFRRFLETSMKNSRSPHLYVQALLDAVLSPAGRDKMLEKFRQVFGRSATSDTVLGNSRTVERGIKIVMGITRKRNLFLPHWSEDDLLWVPGGKG